MGPLDPTQLLIDTQSESDLLTNGAAVLTADPQGQENHQDSGAAEYFNQDLGQGLKLKLIFVPGGSYQIGSPATEVGRFGCEGPSHTVTIAPFWMGKYPVTQAQWKAIASLPQVHRDLKLRPSYFSGRNHPVEQVSWEEVIEFCARLTQKAGQTYRLPTEAEWEYACRAGTTTPFSCGETITPALANYNGNYAYGAGPKGGYREQTIAVGTMQPNTFGLHDMHGNVWEWCADHWHDTYEEAPSDGSAWVIQADERSRRVIRGGAWVSYPLLCRSAYRDGEFPSFRGSYLGFRIVCSGSEDTRYWPK